MSAAGEVQLEVLGRGERPPAVGMRAGAGVLQVAILADLVSGLSIEVEGLYYLQNFGLESWPWSWSWVRDPTGGQIFNIFPKKLQCTSGIASV